jgi:hypothetical protein
MAVKQHAVSEKRSSRAEAEGAEAQRHGSTPFQSLRMVGPWVVTIVSLVVLGAVLLMLVDTGRISAGAARATATATATPTPSPTPSATPLPTPAQGYKLYPNRDEGYYIEYPAQWAATPHGSSWLEISDKDPVLTPAAVTYDLQVFVQPWNGPDAGTQTDQAAQATAWVNHILSGGFVDGQVTGTFTRLPGQEPPVLIGGETWQTGEGVLVQDTTRYRVRVYATIHANKPYIIILTAVDAQFDRGRTLYFTPMLSSFTFLTPTP